ncbi:MAG: GntR family transcriptional regulator [Pigmentiphaga sp.]
MTTSSAPLSRREEAYERLLAAIIYSDLQPGSAVDEKSLADRFDVGLAGIRDALVRLESEGFVERQPRIGTKIAALGLRELHDVFETRFIIEPMTAYIAAKRAELSDIDRLLQLADRYREIGRTRDLRELVLIDQQFHRAVAAATKNAFLERQVTILTNSALRFLYANAPRLSDAARQENLADHIEVIIAIQRRQPEAAQRAMRRLIGEVPGFVDSSEQLGFGKP